MGEGFRSDMTLGLLLQSVVADRGRGRQAFLDVASLQDLPRPVGKMSPDASQAIRLQFDPDR